MNWFKKLMLPKGALYDTRFRFVLTPPNELYECKIMYWSGFRWKVSDTIIYYIDSRKLNRRTTLAKRVDR